MCGGLIMIIDIAVFIVLMTVISILLVLYSRAMNCLKHYHAFHKHQFQRGNQKYFDFEPHNYSDMYREEK
jgi:hypothetical protein